MATTFKPPHLSYSQINLYKSCPRCYFLQYVMGCKPIETPEAFIFGGIFHEALAAHYRGGDFWRGFQVGVAKNKVSSAGVIAGYRKTMTEMWEYFKIFGAKYNASKVEHPFDSVLQNPLTKEVLPIPFKGVLDLETVENDVVDHKTAAEEFGEEKLDDPQLLIYSMVKRRMTGRPPRKLIFSVFLKKGKAARWHEMVTEPDEIKEAILFLEIKQVVKQMAMGMFEPKPDAPFYHQHHQMCPFHRIRRKKKVK